MTNENNEYAEAYAEALGVSTSSIDLTNDTLAALRSEINQLRAEILGLRENAVELAGIAFNEQRYGEWFEANFVERLDDMVETMVREKVEYMVDDDYINSRVDLSEHDVAEYVDTDAIARDVLNDSGIEDKIEEMINDAIDGLEVQITR